MRKGGSRKCVVSLNQVCFLYAWLADIHIRVPTPLNRTRVEERKGGVASIDYRSTSRLMFPFPSKYATSGTAAAGGGKEDEPLSPFPSSGAPS
jgi:hypothetical protein